MLYYLRKYAWALLAAVPIALYLKTLSFGFVWDDNQLFRLLPYYQHLLDVFKPIQLQELPINYFRPLALLSWVIDYNIWGVNPFGHHATEVLLHAVNVILVYLLTRQLLASHVSAHLGAAAIAALFAVHPIQTEVVCWISGRPELLFTMFILICFIFFIYYRNTRKNIYIILSLVSWLCALFSKETAIVFPFCLILYDFLLTVEKNKKTFLKTYGWFILVFLFYLFLRRHYLVSSHIKFIEGLSIGGALKRTLLAYSFYIQQAVFPVSLKAIVFELPVSLAFTFLNFVTLGCVFLIGVLTFGIKDRLPLFVICFFLIMLSPAILVAVTGISETPVAERYLYLPSYSICFLFGCIVISGTTGKYNVTLKWIVFLGIFMLFCYQTLLRIPIWRNDLVFSQVATAQNPDFGLPYQRLGLIYKKTGDYPRAIDYYNKALSSKKYSRKGRAVVYNNLGVIFMDLGKYDAAERYLQKGLGEMETPRLYYNFGLLYSKRADGVKAGKERRDFLQMSVNYLKECLKITPDYKQAQVLLARVENLREENEK